MSIGPLSTPEPTVAIRRSLLAYARPDRGSAVRVTVAGEIDLATVPELDQALRRAGADAALVVLDLRALKSMDSSAARLLLAADRRIRHSGGLLLVVRCPGCLEVVDQQPSQAGASAVRQVLPRDLHDPLRDGDADVPDHRRVPALRLIARPRAEAAARPAPVGRRPPPAALAGGSVAMIVEYQKRIRLRMRRGGSLDDVEEEVIGPSGLCGRHKAALWLYAWSRVSTATQRAHASGWPRFRRRLLGGGAQAGLTRASSP